MAVKIYQYYMKNYEYDIEYVNAINLIIVDLLQLVPRTVLVFDMK